MAEAVAGTAKSLMSELMRRNVVRAGVAYLAFAWVILKLADIIARLLSLPEALTQAVTLLLGLGFVVALIVSWLYEITPKGLLRTSEVGEEQSITHTTARRLDHLILAGLVLVAAVALLERLVIDRLVAPVPVVATPTPAEPPKPPVVLKSLGVLPFTAAGTESQAVAEGFTRALRERLSGLEGLRVTGAGSAFSAAAKGETPEAMAKGLNADHLLKGSLSSQKERLSLAAELIDARATEPLWSQSFDIAPAELAATEEAIARAVASALKLALSPGDETRLAKRATGDAEAYRQGLIARALLGRRDLASLKSAKAALETAITRDPNDASAHAGLAQAYLLLMVNYGEELKAGEARALEAADKALQLDPGSGLAHRARGSLKRLRVLREGNWQAHGEALADFRRAAELEPGDPDAYQAYGAEMALEDPAQAVTLFQKALAIDPLLPQARLDVAGALASMGDTTGALNAFQSLVAAHESFAPGHSAYGVYQARLGRLDEAAVALRKAFQLSPDPFTALYLWAVETELGNAEAAERARARIKGGELFDTLRKALGSSAQARYAEAQDLLERSIRKGTDEGRFVHAAAILALSQKAPQRALDLLQQRYPTFFAGEPINVLNFHAALDLAAAWQATGNGPAADALLTRVAAFLDSPKAPKLPYFRVARAQAHALKGDLNAAMAELDKTYDAGFRLTWAVLAATRPGQINPFPIAIDARFGALRDDPRFQAWLSGIKDDNARQADDLKQRLASPAPPAPAN